MIRMFTQVYAFLRMLRKLRGDFLQTEIGFLAWLPKDKQSLTRLPRPRCIFLPQTTPGAETRILAVTAVLLKIVFLPSPIVNCRSCNDKVDETPQANEGCGTFATEFLEPNASKQNLV